MSDKSLINAALTRRTATVWNVQPQQQHQAESDDSTDDDTQEVDDTAEEDDSESVDDSEQESTEEKDWKAEFEAQQRINRSLERKSKKDLARIQSLESQTTTVDTDAEAEARKEFEATTLARANAIVVKAELRAAATGRLSDPDDALAFIEIGDIEVDEEDGVDRDSLNDAIDDLLRRKPHLAVQDSSSKKPKPDRSQGAGGKGMSSAEQQFAAAMSSLL